MKPVATRIARFALLTLLAGTLSAQIPATYADLYSTLQRDLGDWQSSIDVLCAGCPSYPWFGVGELITANANNGPGNVTTANYMTAVDAEILMHKALGVKAIAVEVSFPMLYPAFFPSQGTTYDQWASFYSTVAAHIRNQGLQVVVESQALLSLGVGANWISSVPAFYATFTSFSQYAAARAAAVANVAAIMNPDYFVLQEEPDTEVTQSGQPVSTVSNAVLMLNGSVAAARGTVGFTGKVGAGFGSWLQQYDAFAKAYTQQACGTCVASKLDFLDIHLFPVNENASCSGCPTACVPCSHPDFVRTNAMSVIATAATATNNSGGPMQMTMSQGWLRKVRDTEWPSPTVLDGGLYTSGDLQEARDSYSFWETDQSGVLLDQAWLTAVASLANYAHFLWLCPFNTQNWSAYMTWSTANALNGEGSTDPNNTPVNVYNLEINTESPARANASYTAMAQLWHNTLVPSDVTAPTPPTGVTATATSPSTIQLTWNASTDDVGVAGYQIWRNGVLAATDLVSPLLDTGLAANTTYNYQVYAFDLANNVSLAASASATTGDTTAPTVPAGLTVQATSASQLNLTWTASTDPDSPVAGYFIYRNGTKVASSATNSYQDNGMLPSTTYTYMVSADDPLGNTSAQSAPVSATTPADTTPPSVPTGLVATVLSLTQISLSWAAATDPDSAVAGYFVYRNGTKVGYSATPSYQDAGLLASITYSYTVAAYDAAANTSPQSTAILATTFADTTAPSVPAGLTAAPASMTQVNLSWTVSTDPDSTVKGYYIYRNGTKVAASTATSYQDINLAPATTYSYTVAAYDPSLNTSVPSTAVSGTTLADTTAPTAPAGLTAAPASMSQVNLSWTASTDPDSTVKGYYVYRNGTKVAASTATSYQDTGLTLATTYTYTVAAYDPSLNTSPQSTAVSGTTMGDTTAPSVPAGLTATPVSQTQINLSWTASTDPDSTVKAYYVYRNGVTVATATTTSYQDTTLTLNTTYSYTVSAFDPTGNVSAQCTAVSATTLADTTAPSVPAGLTATPVSQTQINLSWTVSTDPDSTVKAYYVYRNGVTVATATTNSYQDAGLTLNTTYNYTVSAFDPTGNVSAQCAAVSATTLADTTAPSVPAGLTATPVSQTQINLSWTASTDPDSTVKAYYVYRNGVTVATATTTSYQDSGLVLNTTYSYTVAAFDPTGNVSAQCTAVSGTTLADTTAPSVPAGVAAAPFSSTQVNISWTASTDPDSPVAGYFFYRNGVKIATTTTTSYQDTGLMPGVTYSYAVAAYDASVNTSAQSAPVSATTLADTTPPSVPTGLTAAAVSLSQINLSWTASTDPDSPVTGYFLYRNGVRIATTTTTSYQDTGLTPAVTFSYTVAAYDPSVNTSAQSTAVSATTLADSTPPSVPTGLTAAAVSLSQINLSWAASTDPDSPVTGYFVYRNGVKVASPTTTTYQDTGLTPAVTYSYTVAAFDPSVNTSAQSTAVSATTLADTTPPSVPTGLTAAAISSGQINLSWAASTDPDSTVKGYNVYRNGTKVGFSTTTTYQDTGLTPATTYSYTVSAYDPTGNTSAQSAAVSGATLGDTTAPSAPTGLKATVISGSQINLSWTASTDPDSPVAGYNVYRNGTQVGASATTSFQSTGLTPGVTYTYTVSAYDPAGNTSAQSTPVSATTTGDTTPPSTPTSLSATSVSSSQINLSWNASSDPDSPVAGYNVYRNGTIVGTSPTNSYQDTGLTPSTFYTYKVSAYDAAGNTSGQSFSSSATTKSDTTAPTVPTGLKATVISGSQINLSWNASTDPDSPVSGYNVYRNGSKIGTSTTTSFQNTGLTQGTTYSYTVSAYDPAGNTSAQSTAVSATTTPDTTPPSVPTGLSAFALSSSQISLSWRSSTDPDSPVSGYNVYRNGSKVGTSTNTSYVDSGLQSSTTYTYTVSAYDPSGNTSAQSSSVSAKTNNGHHGN